MQQKAVLKQRTKQNQIRMSDDFKARIKKYQERLQKTNGPEVQVSFSSATRTLIDSALRRVGL